MTTPEAKAQPNYAYQSDVDYLRQRVTTLEARIRLLVRMLLDKKVLGDEAAKTFMETSEKSRVEQIADYYRKKKTQ